MGNGIIGIALGVGMLATGQGASAQNVDQPDRPVLCALVTNQAKVARKVLAAAEKDAAAIYAAAGVEVIWVHEPLGRGTHPTCQVDVVVELLHESGAKAFPPGVSPLALGIALVSPTAVGRRGNTAWIIFDRVEKHAVAHKIQISRLCGIAMAHEMGHMMLPPGHSKTGLMHETWDLRTGFLEYFDESQARTIRTQLTPAKPTDSTR